MTNRRRRIHDKSCLLYDYDPRLTKGLDEAATCRCAAPCDPGAAVEFVITDAGVLRPFDPARDMRAVAPSG